MRCTRPTRAYWSSELSPRGKRQLSFSRSVPVASLEPAYLRCGKCDACRLTWARDWAVRCMHEASLHEDNSVCTLTYDDEHLPVDGSLVQRDMQLFLKSLRKSIAPARFKYFYCGEYGGLSGRPHYHIIFFGWSFPDKRFVFQRNRYRVYESNSLSSLWTSGFHELSDVSPAAVSYVCRYAVKKFRRVGKPYVNEDGVLLSPEFVRMSRGGRHGHGLGYDWFQAFSGDVFPRDRVHFNGSFVSNPRYYDKLLEDADPALREVVREARESAMDEEEVSERSLRRMRVREGVIAGSLTERGL